MFCSKAFDYALLERLHSAAACGSFDSKFFFTASTGWHRPVVSCWSCFAGAYPSIASDSLPAAAHGARISAHHWPRSITILTPIGLRDRQVIPTRQVYAFFGCSNELLWFRLIVVVSGWLIRHCSATRRYFVNFNGFHTTSIIIGPLCCFLQVGISHSGWIKAGLLLYIALLVIETDGGSKIKMVLLELFKSSMELAALTYDLIHIFVRRRVYVNRKALYGLTIVDHLLLFYLFWASLVENLLSKSGQRCWFSNHFKGSKACILLWAFF